MDRRDRIKPAYGQRMAAQQTLCREHAALQHAVHRYRLFGKYDTCLMPTPDIRSRFLTGLDEVA